MRVHIAENYLARLDKKVYIEFSVPYRIGIKRYLHKDGVLRSTMRMDSTGRYGYCTTFREAIGVLKRRFPQVKKVGLNVFSVENVDLTKS